MRLIFFFKLSWCDSKYICKRCTLLNIKSWKFIYERVKEKKKKKNESSRSVFDNEILNCWIGVLEVNTTIIVTTITYSIKKIERLPKNECIKNGIRRYRFRRCVSAIYYLNAIRKIHSKFGTARLVFLNWSFCSIVTFKFAPNFLLSGFSC